MAVRIYKMRETLEILSLGRERISFILGEDNSTDSRRMDCQARD